MICVTSDNDCFATTVKPRFTAPRFTVNPDLPHLQPFPQTFTRIFTFLSYNHVILCKEGSRLPFRHHASLPLTTFGSPCFSLHSLTRGKKSTSKEQKSNIRALNACKLKWQVANDGRPKWVNLWRGRKYDVAGFHPSIFTFVAGAQRQPHDVK